MSMIPKKIGWGFKPGKAKPIITTPGPPKESDITLPTDTGLVIAITGHRPPKVGGYKVPNAIQLKIIQDITEYLEIMKPKAVITGMALGVDQWMAEICINKDIPFIAAIPHMGQESIWPPASQTHYLNLLTKATDKALIHNGLFNAGVMQKRNEWMVDRCHILIAVYDGTAGGTGNCIEYAQKTKKAIKFIDIPKNPPPLSLNLTSLKKPSELPGLMLKEITQEQQQLQMEFMEMVGLPIKNSPPPAPKYSMSKKGKLIIQGAEGEIFSKEKIDENANPFERFVDLD